MCNAGAAAANGSGRRHRVVVVGSCFAGLTAALEVSINELGAVCILDAGNGGMAIKTDRVFGGGKTHVTSGPHAHWGKVAFEKAFLLSRKRGSVVF